MSDNPAFDLMTELGPVLDPAQIVYFEDQATWRILLDEKSLLDLVYEARTGQFVFEVGLGPIPEEKQSTIHELLLRFSYLWKKNGGVFVALDDEGEGVLMFRSALADLDVTRLQALIGNLLDLASRWQELISEEVVSAGDDENLPDDFLSQGAILV